MVKLLPKVPSPKWRVPGLGHVLRFAALKGNMIFALPALHKECGPTFQFIVPHYHIVVTQDPELSKAILMSQGPEAHRGDTVWMWEDIFKRHHWPEAIPFVRGERWRTYRKVLSKSMLLHKSAAEFLPVAGEKVTRLMTGIRSQLEPAVDGIQRLPNPPTTPLKGLFSIFLLEVVIEILLGVDFKLMPQSRDAAPDPKAVAFYKSVEDIFELTNKVNENPLSPYMKTKARRRLEEAWTISFEFSLALLRPVMEEYKRTGSLPQRTAKNTMLPLLVKQLEAGEINEEELLMIGVSATQAAVDSSAQTLEYVLYQLARHPEYQDRVVKEIQALGKKQNTPWPGLVVPRTLAELNELPFLQNCVKESMRLIPTVGLHVRRLVKPLEYDSPAGRVVLPEGQYVMINSHAMGRDPKYVGGGDPDKFIPERFETIREDPEAAKGNDEAKCPHKEAAAVAGANGCPHVATHPYAVGLSFGHGSRKCPGAGFGRVMAELGTSAVLSTFKVGYTGPDITLLEKGVTRPSFDLSPHFTFSPRS